MRTQTTKGENKSRESFQFHGIAATAHVCARASDDDFKESFFTLREEFFFGLCNGFFLLLCVLIVVLCKVN